MQRLDGILSMGAAYAGGVLTTRPVLFRGSRQLLNINTAESGKARVALLDRRGKAVTGFSEGECETINGNYTNYEAR